MTARETTTTTTELSVPSPANISLENVIASHATIDASENIAMIERSYCRICSEDASKEALAIFCDCGSPDGFTHLSCLETRLSDDDLVVYSCDVCNYIFEVERVNTPILQWTKNKDERHNLILLIAITLGYNVIMLATIIKMLDTFVRFFPLDAFTIISDTTVTIIIIVGYCYGLYILNRYTARSWRNLCESNQKVKLVLPPKQL